MQLMLLCAINGNDIVFVLFDSLSGTFGNVWNWKGIAGEFSAFNWLCFDGFDVEYINWSNATQFNRISMQIDSILNQFSPNITSKLFSKEFKSFQN